MRKSVLQVRPRVAMLVGDFPRLSETFIVSQIGGLLDAGIDVSVFADDRDGNGLSHPLLVTRDIVSDTRFAADHFLYRLAKLIRRPYRLATAMKLFATDITDSKLADNFDVLICHFGVNGLRALRAKHRSHAKGQIWTAFHGYDLQAHFHYQSGSRYRELFREGDLFLPVCEFFRTRLIEYGAPPDRIFVHRMGTDVENIRPRRAGVRDDKRVRIISVARMVEKKGLEFAIRALKLVRDNAPDAEWSYQVLGDGPRRQDLESLATHLQLDDRVAFLGAQPHARTLEAIKEADIFLLPSVTASDHDIEGCPVAIIESMAAGLPVIASWHSGIPEVVLHNRTGLLAGERNIGELAAHLVALLRCKELRESFGREGRKLAEERLDNRALHKILAERIALVANAQT
jgi:colanic acid/amylovoran biosynthesis glycosyltransferase